MITEHKPLIPLMNSKDLDSVPIRCKRLLMLLMSFYLETEYAPGKTLVKVDALSRSPQSDMVHNKDSHSDVERYIAAVMSSKPLCKEGGLNTLQTHTLVLGNTSHEKQTVGA